MDIINTSDAGNSQGVKIVVYGGAGVGKTRLSATTGDLEHTLILSAEAGLLSLRDHQIDAIVIKSLDDLRAAVGLVRRAVKSGVAADELEAARAAAGDGEKPPIKRYRWVIVDSISEIAEVVLRAELDSHNDGRRAYGEMADQMMAVFRALRDTRGVNLVMTAKMSRYEDNGAMIYGPMFPGRQLEQNLPYLFDEVFALRVARDSEGGVKRWLQTRTDGYFEAKDRSGSLAPSEPPNLEHIANKIFGDGGARALTVAE